MRKSVLTLLLSLFFVQASALGQSNSEESGEYREVFGISRAADQTGYFKLPETRDDWLDVAEKIRIDDVDDWIVYTMAMGEPPADIFTPDLSVLYYLRFERWLEQKLNEVQPGSEDYKAYSYNKSLLDNMAQQNQTGQDLPATKDLNELYEILLEEIRAQRRDKD